MSCNTATIAFGEFMFHQSGEQPGGGPAFLVSLLRKLRPECLDGRQTQFIQREGEAGGIGLGGLRHAGPPSADTAQLTNRS